MTSLRSLIALLSPSCIIAEYILISVAFCAEPPAAVEVKPPEDSPIPLVIRIDKGAIFRYTDSEPDHRGRVDKFVLGSHAIGESHTTGETRGELIPDSDEAAFDVVFRGRTVTNTAATKQPAVVYSRTFTDFVCRRHIVFEPHKGFVAVGETEIQANTRLSLDGYAATRRFGRRLICFFAERQSEQLREQARCIADRDNRKEVVTGFEAEIDKQVKAANEGLDFVRYVDRFLGEKTSLQLFAKSADDHIQIGVGPEGEKYAPLTALPPRRDDAHPVELWIHASILSEPVGVVIEALTPNVAIPQLAQTKILGALGLAPESDTPESKATIAVGMQDGWLVLGLPDDQAQRSADVAAAPSANGPTN